MSSPVKNTPAFNTEHALQLAAETLKTETAALCRLQERLANEEAGYFKTAAAMLLGCTGRIVLSGIGKSGHVARKIAATFASTGSPAMFVHPAEALHGDLGMITPDDVFIAISYSGEAAELLSICPIIKRMGAKIIALTGKTRSGLAKLSDVHLSIQVEKEACPLNLAPTASTTVTMALGDALAVAVLDARGFRETDFARSHPGGALGRKLLTLVSDIMRSGEAVPVVRADTPLREALFEITKKGIAMTAVVDDNYRAIGVFTDGDLRRLLEKTEDFSRIPISDVMSRNPRTIGPEKLAAEAVNLMEQHRINQLLVADSQGKLIGAVHIHDLTQAKVI
ncbi:MAG: KpsF/GutQ family sugar-phosphate isomerase [Alistipes senegalensis]|nr:KpsF/GutQ family sugar-phosphate isomerase [Oxalobacter formigenes]MCM1280839.1 KpsF/GutQ family sugar-phosphate isomerase [Alistipes senegalensis]